MGKQGRDEPTIVGTSGVGEGTVWAEVKATIQPTDYESVGVTLGQSLRVDGDDKARKKVRKQLLGEVEREVVARLAPVRKSWRERT